MLDQTGSLESHRIHRESTHQPMKKALCYLVVIFLLLNPISTTHSITVKTQGKLALVAILGGISILTKYLIRRDKQAIKALHAKLGPPDRIIEFERGFDQWRIEWYENQRYLFRNNVLHKETGTRPAETFEAF